MSANATPHECEDAKRLENFDKSSNKSSMQKVMSLGDFRLLFAGVSTSLLGDQFSLIAIPWLVLQLTGDPLALGLVLALEGIPRAAFMLVGGVVTDRFSPKRVLLFADFVRLVLATLMALAILSGNIEMWMLYAFALGFGLVAGFAVPAGNSMVPMLVEERDLQAGNSLVMGGGQIMGFVGPVLAGILIGSFTQSLFGVGLAFAFNAFTFAFSAFMLLLMRFSTISKDTENGCAKSAMAAIMAGLMHVWHDKALRLMFLIIAAVNFLFVGPLLVGIPVLADQRLAEGALAFGLLMSGFSGGSLVGYIVAGTASRPNAVGMRIILNGLLLAFGVVLISVGFLNSTWLDFALLSLLGVGNGYITITLFSYIQARVAKSMMGRIMSLLMLSSLGLVPISQAISGALSTWNLTALFVIAGGLMLLVTFWIASQSAMNTISKSLAGEVN